MTAYMALAYPDRVELLSDGASCLGDGRIIAIRNKVAVSDCLPIAIMSRGFGAELRAIEGRILKAAEGNTVDGLLTWLAQALADGEFAKGKYDYETALCVYSETMGAQVFVFTSQGPTPTHFGELPPYTLACWGSGPLFGCKPFEDDDFTTGPDRELLEVELPKGLAGAGLVLFNAIRRNGYSDPWGTGPAYWVGGALFHTVVSAGGVTTTQLHEWPEDRLFRKIVPTEVRA